MNGCRNCIAINLVENTRSSHVFVVTSGYMAYSITLMDGWGLARSIGVCLGKCRKLDG